MPAFSVFFLIWTCDEIVIPSTPVDFPGICRISGQARQSICSRIRRRKQSERSPQSSSLSPSGLNPPYQIGGHHSVQLGLKLMFSTSRTGAPDIGVPGVEATRKRSKLTR
jgi:hypothetical protein